METLIVTYAVAWAVISGYAAWLAIGNRRLVRRLDRLDCEVVGEPRDLTQVKPAA